MSFRSNHPAVIRIVEEAFGQWNSRKFATDPAGTKPVHVTVLVHGEEESREDESFPPLQFRSVDRERVLLHGPGSVGLADARGREAVAWVTPSVVQSGPHFRDGVVEALTLAVLSHLDRTPFHAAALARGGRALLLAGPSGAGKSTMCYAAVRSGWKLLAEDRVNIQMEGALRVWGLSRFIRLPPSARAHFPELEGLEPSVVSGGREKLVVDVSVRGALPDRPYADRAALVVLERGPTDVPRLEPLTPDALAGALPWGSEPGFDVFREEIEEAVRRLSRPGGWRLVPGGHPDDALPLLDRIFAEIEEAEGG